MATITIENVPEKMIKIYGTKIKYSKDIVFPKKKDIEEMTLLEYINSDEYKNEEPKCYTNAEDFLADLKKGI